MAHEDERSLGRKPGQSRFERGLFRGGVLDLPREMTIEVDQREAFFYYWLFHFNGKIPKRWADHWANASRDFEEAGKRNVQLSPTLVDAGVSHPNPWTVEEVAKTQKLTPEQLAISFAAHPGDWYREQLIEAQRKLGVSEEEIDRAKVLFFDTGIWKVDDTIPGGVLVLMKLRQREPADTSE